MLCVPWGGIVMSRWLIGKYPPPSYTRVLSLMQHRRLVIPHCSSILWSVLFGLHESLMLSSALCSKLMSVAVFLSSPCSQPEQQPKNFGVLINYTVCFSTIIWNILVCICLQVCANNKKNNIHRLLHKCRVFFFSIYYQEVHIVDKNFNSFHSSVYKKSQSAVLLFARVFNVCLFGMQINELAKRWLEFHTCGHLIGICTKIHGASRSRVIHYEISRVTLRRAHLAPAIHFV